MLLQKLDRTGAFTLKKADSSPQKHLADLEQLHQIVSTRKKYAQNRNHHFQNKTFDFNSSCVIFF